jgi:hypothetical protein
MSLSKIVTTLSLALSLSALSTDYVQSQTTQKPKSQSSVAQLTNINPTDTNPSDTDKKESKGLAIPIGKPDFTIDIRAHRKILGIDFSAGAGMAEIRKNNIYINLLSGAYQMMFEQVNDSTFIEHLYTVNLETKKEREEQFTTKIRNNSQILTEYKVLKGEPRKEKLMLENTAYPAEFMPVLTAVNKFLINKLPKKINVVAFGDAYTFSLYTDEKKTKYIKGEKQVVKYAKMDELVKRTPDDIVIMGEYLNIIANEKTIKQNGYYNTLLIPKKFEANFAIINSGIFWNSDNYKAVGIIKTQ